uniref:6b protein n=1 Tax=Infectious bronchitis virus TaxID=11120 RepID=G3C7A4_9GAMC|nr:6b protein [Infectious bronchitis virus]
MDLLHFLVHFVSHYFCAFLSIITGIDCDHVQYLSFFWLLFACCIVGVSFVLLMILSLLYRRSSIVRVKEDRHVA